MNYAVLWVPGFALRALVRAEADLAGRPVAIAEGEGRRACVTEVSAEAAGIEPGLPVALAMARVAGLVVRTRDPEAEAEAQRLLVAAAFTLSPRVELTGPGCCTADLGGSAPGRARGRMELALGELGRAGLPARAGAGATPLIAAYAARQARDILMVEDTAGFLGPLPLAFAEPLPAHAQILRRWGLGTLGELAALSKAEVGLRLGAEGLALWERAAGQAVRVLRLVEPARTFAAAWDYEPPVESLEPLLFRLRRFAERVALELRAAGLAAESLGLTLLLEDETDLYRAFRLPEPTADVDSWMRVLLAHLESVRTPARVAGVRLCAAPARPLAKQDGLFDTGLKDPASFWENLARLAAISGEGRVGTPARTDTHRPDSFTLEKPLESVPAPEAPPVNPALGHCLRRFRPPRPARVLCEGRRPAALESEAASGAVRQARGPWQCCGGWWQPGGWSLETWHVELESGGVYQLARTQGGWFLEGEMD